MGYALIQIGYAIFGVGDTKSEALEDAVEWLDGVSSVGEIEFLEPGENWRTELSVFPRRKWISVIGDNVMAYAEKTTVSTEKSRAEKAI